MFVCSQDILLRSMLCTQGRTENKLTLQAEKWPKASLLMLTWPKANASVSIYRYKQQLSAPLRVGLFVESPYFERLNLMRHDVSQIGELEAETTWVVTHLLFSTSTRGMEQNSDYRSQWNQPLFIIQHEMDLNIFFFKKVDKGSSESVTVTISAGNEGRAISFLQNETKIPFFF